MEVGRRMSNLGPLPLVAFDDSVSCFVVSVFHVPDKSVVTIL